jgi:ELWxxDGT repeat protein
MKKAKNFLPLLVVALLLSLSMLSTGVGTIPTHAQKQQEYRCFPETGYCLTGRILEFWQAHGGLAIFGFPITPQQEKVIDGQPRQVQWFERHRLELHPSNTPPYDVLLGHLGKERLAQQGRDWQTFAQDSQDDTPQPGCRYFAETRQHVCGDFLEAWQANGIELDGQPGIGEAESLALYGLPISGEVEELILVQGEYHVYTVQWFERVRFEHHPQLSPPYHVQRGLLGRETLSPTPTPQTDELSPISSGSYPHQLTMVQDTLFFVAEDSEHGKELWRSDGTTDGTKLVKDIIPGQESSSPFELVPYGDLLFFVAETGNNNGDAVLWRSDGTANGTRPVKDVVEEQYGSGPWQLTVSGDTLFFVADDGIHGTELWRSDGTAEGTVMVQDSVAGEAGMYPRDAMPMGYIPYGLTAVNELLFFHADDGVHGDELWRSDGTPNGTILLKDINAGATPTEYHEMTAVGDYLCFVARTGKLTYELWCSDGTPTGTRMMRSFTKRLPPGVSPPLRVYPHIGGLTAVDGVLYFSVGGEDAGLWRSDGTPDGTYRVMEMLPCCLTSMQGVRYFLHITSEDGKSSLWRSDATLTQPKQIATVPGEARALIAVGDKLFFVAQHQEFSGAELWVSDGTTAGTRLIREVSGGWLTSPDSGLMAAGQGVLFLTGDDGVHGTELWRSDGTAEGTWMVQDIQTLR